MTQSGQEQFNFAHDVVEQWAHKRPEALALWWVDQTGAREKKITFAQMSDRLRCAANAFAHHGIKRGDRVMIVLQRVPQWWEAMLGLIRIGAIPIPGTPLLTSKDIRYRLEMAEVRAIITDEAGAGKVSDDFQGPRFIVAAEKEGWINFDSALEGYCPDIPYEPSNANDPGIIYFTSGTAGEAKMVLHTQASYGQGHRITGQYWLDLSEQDTIWTLADTGWAKSAWSSFFGPWQMGSCIFTMDMHGKFEPQIILHTLEKYPITVFCAPATALRLIVRRDLSVHKFPHLRHCVSAGEALNPPVLAIWKAATGLTIYEGYGQTESVLMIGNFRSTGWEVRPGSMGRPSPGYDVHIVDENGKEMPDGREGNLALRVKPVRPLALFREYWKNPEETADKFVGEWYFTGDRAYRDSEGYFWFVGRADDVINSSSYRIGPSEVESALLEHPAVLEAGVIGVPEELRGEIVKAFVVLRPGFEPSEHLKRDLQTHCKKVTAPYKYPRLIDFIPELPKTISGKIRRVELRRRNAIKK